MTLSPRPRYFLCLFLFFLLLPSPARGFPTVGFVPERSATLGPVASFGFAQRLLLVGLEGVLARRVYWGSLSTRLILQEEGPPAGSAVLEAGLNLLALNVGLGWQARLGEEFFTGPSFVVGLAIPLADIQSDGARIFGGAPFLAPFYRLTFFLGEEGGFVGEAGLSFRLWWR